MEWSKIICVFMRILQNLAKYFQSCKILHNCVDTLAAALLGCTALRCLSYLAAVLLWWSGLRCMLLCSAVTAAAAATTVFNDVLDVILVISIGKSWKIWCFTCHVKGTDPVNISSFIIRFYAIMHRTTIVQSKIKINICSCLFFCSSNIYRPSLGKVWLSWPNPKLIQLLNFYLRRKRKKNIILRIVCTTMVWGRIFNFHFHLLKKKLY